MNRYFSRTGRRPLAALATVLLAASLAVAGCGSGSGDGASSDSGAGSRSKQDAAAGSGSEGTDNKTSGGSGTTGGSRTADLARSYIVRTATLTVEAKNVQDALAKARTLVDGAGGYVGDESTSLDDEGREHSRIQLKVPPQEYEQVLGDLADLGKLTDRKVNAQDVTSQVVDVESRIKSQQTSVTRLRALMGKATKVGDVVTIESELSTREADLEALQAQQKSLKDRTSMATVTLVLTEPEAAPKKDDDGVWASVGDALGAGWNAFCATFRVILIVLAAVLPFAALAVVLWLVWRTVRRRFPARERAREGAGNRAGVTPPPPVTVPAAVGSTDRSTATGSTDREE